MSLSEKFPFVTAQAPLAPLTHLRIGGPAEYLAQPQTREELVALIRECAAQQLRLRVLGGGCNLLIRDEGVSGVVLRLNAPVFTEIAVDGQTIRAGSGTPLSALISTAARHNLAGIETLVGIQGTLGGAIRCNAGDRTGEIGQLVRKVQLIDDQGQIVQRDRDELQFSEHSSNLDEGILLAAELAFESDSTERIVKRMRRSWIQRKATMPFSFQAAVRVFRNPRGQNARELLEKARLAKTRVGGAEVSERNENYIVAHPGTSARDVLRLIDLMHSRVKEQCGVSLEKELLVW